MKNAVIGIGLGLVAGLSALVVTAPPAVAQPSCVAQSQAEHQIYGTSWGRDFIGFLASHAQVLQDLGFSNFGDLARFATSQDPAHCPADL